MSIEKDIRTAERRAAQEGTMASDWEQVTAQCDRQGVWRRVERHTRLRTRRAWAWSAASAAAIITAAALLLFNGERELPVIEAGSTRAVITLAGGGREQTLTLPESGQESGWQRYVAPEDKTVCIEVPRGGEYRLTLADGTRVWLNSESSIEYSQPFDRRVKLLGEAFFDVKKRGGAIFEVATPRQTITVTGTRFNVSDYGDDPLSRTTLLEGRVAVNDAALVPGQQASTAAAGAATVVSTVRAEQYAAWTEGLFEFENMRLGDICVRLERWYDVHFELDTAVADERFTGGAWRNEPLGELLGSIEMVTNVHFVRCGGSITVRKD